MTTATRPATRAAGRTAPQRSELPALARRALAQRSDAPAGDACWTALASAARELLAERWAATQRADARRGRTRRVHYLSMEFLMGRALGNALQALDLQDAAQAALPEGAPPLGEVLEHEPDAALGNGGLGRLAACFLDSFATLGLPSFGYGLRYRHGMFAQAIQDGRQIERPDTWLEAGSPWELPRPELRYTVGFGGHVRFEGGQHRWEPAETVAAQAIDFIVPGHGTERVSTLRQWQAEAAQPIDLTAFSRGDHAQAGQQRLAAERLNWVLYPDDSTPAGRELRLRQEFLLVSASLQDLLARHLREGGDIHQVGRANVVHLNDTHPALAPLELMRLLLDEHGLDWDAAWQATHQATSYTNHTLMPEALETWPLDLVERLLPRHLAIAYEINHRFLDEVRARFPGDEARVARMSLFDEGQSHHGGERRLRMAALAVVASHKVNGVSALHSQLMVDTLFADYAQLWPERFLNVTNGVTPRRWLVQANPGLAGLLDKHIGAEWRQDLSALGALRAKAGGKRIGAEFLRVKRAAKARLAAHIREELGLVVREDALFDVQVKRIHEYKRQLLNLLQVIARYQAIVADPGADWVPRVVVFAGKAASAYRAAKGVIALIHDVARVVNTDPRLGDRLKLVFLPNYSVSLAELIIPAADLSEQISTAGTEASGTGNMKFALNGALTVGTWDGANIEMAEAMGVDEMFVFGLRADEAARIKALGYDPRLYIEGSRVLQQVIDAIAHGSFAHGDPQRHRELLQPLLQHDPYLLMADFDSYLQAQARVDALWRDPAAWAASALRNIAGLGGFSSDRTIGDYLREVWAPPAR
ncbi:glycogen/starch/alpha-glucan phosphorylase [Ideonella sp. 4Y16]|uniref:glycogen/starch/alpha-glucan phosphorylase n=1 Tax=Ideonella alba TaxID=2824118 RepID=UPI001B39ABCE|nr:glycogen/starch/alpha-glucan phosphorylase [Ideonella alba]MBQ0941722.1 glycogen/starch/alpha-glucan phosphorylase [Ideonella alba]